MSNLPANPFAFKSEALETQLKSTSTNTTYNVSKQSGFQGLPSGGIASLGAGVFNPNALSTRGGGGQDLRSLRDNDGDDDPLDDIFGGDDRSRSYRVDTSTQRGNDLDAQQTLDLPPPAAATIAAPGAADSSTSSAATAAPAGGSDDSLWDQAFSSIDEELATIDAQAKQHEAKQLDDMIYQVSKAIQSGEMIPLPTQSDESKEFTRTVMELYNKDKKNVKVRSKKQRLKAEIAAKKAEDRFDKFDALTQNTGSYRKSLQKKRKNERKKLDW